DELGGNPKPIAGLANAAFQYGTDAKQFGDLSDVQLFSLECKCGGARDHFQARRLCEQIDDFLRQAVTEILVVFVRAHVGKWENCNRRTSLTDSGRSLRESGLHCRHRLKTLGGLFGEATAHELLHREGCNERRWSIAQDGTENVRCGVSIESAGSG